MMPTCFRRSPNRVSTTTDAPRARSHMGLHKRVQKPRGRHSGIIGRTPVNPPTGICQLRSRDTAVSRSISVTMANGNTTERRPTKSMCTSTNSRVHDSTSAVSFENEHKQMSSDPGRDLRIHRYQNGQQYRRSRSRADAPQSDHTFSAQIYTYFDYPQIVCCRVFVDHSRTSTQSLRAECTSRSARSRRHRVLPRSERRTAQLQLGDQILRPTAAPVLLEWCHQMTCAAYDNR